MSRAGSRAAPAAPVGPVTDPAADPVAELIADLDRRLRGPRRLRDDMLAEAADGLADAVDAYERAGMTAEQAAERAVAEFGAPADVLPGYRAELAAGQARRSVLLVALSFPGLVIAWDVLWMLAAPGPAVDAPTLVWLRAADWYGLLVGVPALALLALLGRPYRRSAQPRRLALVAGWLAVTAGTANMLVWLAISGLEPATMARMAVESPAAGGMLAFSAAVMGLVIASGRSSVALGLSAPATEGSRVRSPR